LCATAVCWRDVSCLSSACPSRARQRGWAWVEPTRSNSGSMALLQPTSGTQGTPHALATRICARAHTHDHSPPPSSHDCALFQNHDRPLSALFSRQVQGGAAGGGLCRQDFTRAAVSGRALLLCCALRQSAEQKASTAAFAVALAQWSCSAARQVVNECAATRDRRQHRCRRSHLSSLLHRFKSASAHCCMCDCAHCGVSSRLDGTLCETPTVPHTHTHTHTHTHHTHTHTYTTHIHPPHPALFFVCASAGTAKTSSMTSTSRRSRPRSLRRG
jgi:hypothetical protein